MRSLRLPWHRGWLGRAGGRGAADARRPAQRTDKSQRSDDDNATCESPGQPSTNAATATWATISRSRHQIAGGPGRRSPCTSTAAWASRTMPTTTSTVRSTGLGQTRRRSPAAIPIRPRGGGRCDGVHGDATARPAAQRLDGQEGRADKRAGRVGEQVRLRVPEAFREVIAEDVALSSNHSTLSHPAAVNAASSELPSAANTTARRHAERERDDEGSRSTLFL
jgi:hypothetical protein